MKQHNHNPENVFLQNPTPESGFLRLKQIIGDPKAVPPIPAILPVSKSTWWEGVASGRFPRPVRLSARTVAWSAKEIRALIANLIAGGEHV